MKLKEKTNSGIIFSSKKGKQIIIIWEDASGNVIVETKEKSKKSVVHKVFLRDTIDLVGDVDLDSEE